MPDIDVYLKHSCPFCKRAKRLLDGKGVAYREIDIAGKPELKAEMMDRANGRRTVPQIFIGERHVGGFDDLSEMDMDDELDPLLGLA